MHRRLKDVHVYNRVNGTDFNPKHVRSIRAVTNLIVGEIARKARSVLDIVIKFRLVQTHSIVVYRAKRPASVFVSPVAEREAARDTLTLLGAFAD